MANENCQNKESFSLIGKIVVKGIVVGYVAHQWQTWYIQSLLDLFL